LQNHGLLCNSECRETPPCVESAHEWPRSRVDRRG
jgi:hypothetical protein